ncbi:Coiled-coil domain-containing protein 191 [Eumeta japonica]|uniref:Coiled-coil domain-containing protein 191 n=1 Tax=Eumeta variegata TaxID=151549 RepID=A0A4C1YVZ7_EUMVA|nr:Coiled-coil domain-containing protein 191 [Eumeta japonica]
MPCSVIAYELVLLPRRANKRFLINNFLKKLSFACPFLKKNPGYALIANQQVEQADFEIANTRKCIHRRVPSDSYKIGKEIARIRSAYAADHLKNKFSLRNCTDAKPNKDSIVKKSYNVITNKSTHDSHSKYTEKDIDNQEKVNDGNDVNLIDVFDKQCQLSNVNQLTKSINDLDKKQEGKGSKRKFRKSTGNKICKNPEIKDVITYADSNKQIDIESSNLNTISGKKINTFHNDITEHLRNENEYSKSDKINQTPKYETEENSTISSSEDLQSVLIRKVIRQDVYESDANKYDSSPSLKNIDEPAVDHSGLFVSSSPIKENKELDFLSVVPLRIDNDFGRIYLLYKKYIQKWRMYIERKKETILQKRKVALDNFFDKLKEKKLIKNKDANIQNRNKIKLLVKDYNTYQHRYKMQQHVIALQKAKLEEQNKIIEQLKYNKIIEASKQSVDDMRETVRMAYSEIDRHLRPKIKCLSNELKLHELQEPTLILHCLKVPQFLQRMEKRAREREEKHAVIRERRRQMEEERIRLKQQADLAKAQMDKEEKMKIMKELREKRKREKIESIRKKQRAERMRALTVMADLHYERNLLTKYGIRAFVRLIELKRDNECKAKSHCVFQLKKNVFLNWMWYTEDMWFDRNYRAEDFRRKKLMRKVFAAFKKNHHEFVLKKQVAEDYYELYLVQLVFRKFLEAFQIIIKGNERKMEIAATYYNTNLIFKIFTHWRTLPALNALERVQEARKARWRQRVLQVVPDYTPPED